MRRKLFLIQPFLLTNLENQQVSLKQDEFLQNNETQKCAMIEECFTNLKMLNIDVPQNIITNTNLTIDLTKDDVQQINAPCFLNLVIDYKNYNFEHALFKALPSSISTLSKFTMAGHVLQFNLRPEHLPFKHIIGRFFNFNFFFHIHNPIFKMN